MPNVLLSRGPVASQMFASYPALLEDWGLCITAVFLNLGRKKEKRGRKSEKRKTEKKERERERERKELKEKEK